MCDNYQLGERYCVSDKYYWYVQIIETPSKIQLINALADIKKSIAIFESIASKMN
jgi:hypothetical protein